MVYIRPTSKTTKITDDWREHKARGSGLPGTDWATPIGERIFAPADGVVTRAGSTPAANGKNIRILHDDGFTTYHLHLSRIDVATGQRVVQGQVIGLSGNTGKSTGPHYHLSVANPAGQLIDPETIIGKETGTEVKSLRTIKLGSRGPAVKYLQLRLGVFADGLFGPMTRRAVIRFQKSKGLVADGIVGPKTWKALG